MLERYVKRQYVYMDLRARPVVAVIVVEVVVEVVVGGRRNRAGQSAHVHSVGVVARL